MSPPPGPPTNAPHGTWVIDLDGVIWLTGEPIGDVGGAVAALRAAGVRTLFATNNSAPTRAESDRFVDAILPLDGRMLSRLVVGSLLPAEGRHAA